MSLGSLNVIERKLLGRKKEEEKRKEESKAPRIQCENNLINSSSIKCVR